MKKLLILATIVFLARADIQAPFQASIQLKDSNGNQLCNGIIIHEEFILTTANCLYLRVTIAGRDFSILVPESDLKVVVGGSLTPTERNVVSIIPHNKFNRTTYDNDVAVLKLDRALPLANSTEIQRLDITTGSGGNSNARCFLTVFNSSQASSDEGFYSIWKQPAVENCNDENGTNLIHKMDLCLEYFLSTSENCNSTSINLIQSNERGTAYVCDNKLVAILADINPPRSVEKCLQKKQTTAFFVDVGSYIEWLSQDLGISFQHSVPSWTLKPENSETSLNSSTTDSTTGASSNSNSVATFYNNFFAFLLLVKLAIF